MPSIVHQAEGIYDIRGSERPEYHYMSLSLEKSRREIRLVTIQPGKWTEALQCTLEVCDLSTAPAYDALSYVWGDAEDTRPILLDGYRFRVTSNLESALRHLRSHEPRTMWIDAICINQCDLDERASQVQLMRDIYQHASTVFGWLGEATRESEDCFTMLRFLSDTSDYNWTEKNVQGKTRRVPRISRPALRRGLYGLEDIMSRPWWTRVWIIQEISSRAELQMMCGRDSIPWQIMYFMVIEMQTLVGDYIAGTSINNMRAFLRISGVRQPMTSGYRVPLSMLVANIRGMKSTDPRDMVYSLLGLAADFDDPLLVPNYHATTSKLQVYQNLVEHTIREEKSLNLICMRRREYEEGSWPSWVPDWSAIPPPPNLLHQLYSALGFEGRDLMDGPTLTATPLLKFYQGHIPGHEPCEESFKSSKSRTFGLGTISTPCELWSSSWNAALDQPANAIIERGTSTLYTRGICVDTVHDLGDPLLLSFNSISLQFFSWHYTILRNFGTCKTMIGRDIFKAFDQFHCLYLVSREGIGNWYMRVIIWVIYMFSFPIRQWWRFYRRLEERKLYAANQADYVSGGSVLEAYVKTLWLGNVMGFGMDSEKGYNNFFDWSWTWDENLVSGVINQLRVNLLHRQFLISKKGYIGLVPMAAMKGDLVCVLFGCSMPVVLRKVGNHYIFVGESYVHGLMDGQAIRLLRAGKLHEENFNLK